MAIHPREALLEQAIDQCLDLRFIRDELKPHYSFRMERGLTHATKETEAKCDQISKKWLFHNAILSAYGTVDISKRKPTILIAGFVGQDGVGDYYFLKQAKKILQLSLPDSSITVAAEILNLSERQKDFSPSDCILSGVTSKNRKFEPEDANQVQNLETTDLTIALPHETFMHSCFKDKKPDLHIMELGGRDSENTAFPLGVSPFSEWGFLWKHSDKKEIAEISDPALRTQLFGISDAEKYSSTHSLYFGYMHNYQDKKAFVNTAIEAELKRDQKDYIDVIIPGPHSDTFLNWKHPAIAEVQIFDNKESSPQVNRINSKGKILRILNVFPIPNEDMQILIQNANQPVGCTGDMSFFEVLSNHQLPFYEICRHKEDFWDSFIPLVEELFPEKDSPLCRYLSDLKRRGSNLGQLVHHERLSEELQILCDHLKKHYNFNEIFIDMVKRALLLKENPELKQHEAQLLDSYLSAKIPLSECYHSLLTRLPNR